MDVRKAAAIVTEVLEMLIEMRRTLTKRPRRYGKKSMAEDLESMEDGLFH
jgi:hypothetical protein